MRIKAFTLVEIIVVILLTGVIFSLALSSYMSKEKKEKLYSLKDLTFYMKKNIVRDNGTFFIYGELCQNAVFRTQDLEDIQMPNFGFTSQNQVLKENMLERFELIDFMTEKFKDKNEKLCFELHYKNRKFFDKYIIHANNIYYFLSPFRQSVTSYDTLELAQTAYLNYALYPTNRDDYYDK